jgi:hypothetical protein
VTRQSSCTPAGVLQDAPNPWQPRRFFVWRAWRRALDCRASLAMTDGAAATVQKCAQLFVAPARFVAWPFSERSPSPAYGPPATSRDTSMTTIEKRRDIVLSCVAACLLVAIVMVMAS